MKLTNNTQLIIVLELLAANEPLHGYAIYTRAKQRDAGVTTAQQIYRTVKQMGLDSAVQDQKGAPPRRVYTLPKNTVIEWPDVMPTRIVAAYRNADLLAAKLKQLQEEPSSFTRDRDLADLEQLKC